ncbi:unnamed protein product [Ostreobium quekettii]|uniref:Uncharacterized protein n=1 Tax=Ostreobium quekettii TaxID=121088 RepID=A0A8S1IXW4_9CHLO|nr:unnamed protein product [Ostreobium quekettii]
MEGEEPPAELDARKSQLASMKKTTLDFSFCEDAGMGDDFASASTSEEIATQIMAELGHLTKAARSAEKILTAVLRALDERHGWKADEPVVAASVGVLHQAFAEQHHQFLLFTVLLRHASSADHLSVSERACLIRLAVNEGLSQERHFLSAVLAQCLTHLPAQLPLLADVPVLGSATSTSGGELDVPKPLPKANGNMEEEDLRTAVLDSIAEVSGSIEDTGVLVDELTRILAQLRLPNGLGKGDSADAVVAVLECVAAALRAVVLRPDEGRKIPFSKKNDMFLELLSLHLSLPALPRLQIHRLLQILVPAGIGESTLPPALVSGFLTAVYNELLDANLVPESFVAIAGTFAVVMRSSDARGWVTGLQFVNLLVTMALKDHETSSLALGAVRQGAIILLANTSLLQLSMVVDCPDLETATLDTGDILKPCLRISITNAGQMQAFSQAFPDKLDRQATEQLRNLCESEPDLPGRLIKLGCKVSSLRNAFGSQLEDMLGTCFSPDSSDGIPQRAKRPLSQGRCSTPEGSISPCEPEATEQTRAMDFSRKVLAVLSKGSSWKEGPYQMPRPRSVQELLAVDENDADTTKNSTGGDNGGEEDEPDGKKTTSRTAALKSVLSMLDREHGSDGKTNSLNMDDLVLGLDPIS